MLFRKDHLVSTQKFYEKHGGKTIIIARFMPAVRTFAPVVAGVGRWATGVSLTFNVLGGVGWVASMLFLGFFLGKVFDAKQIEKIVYLIVFISILPLIIGAIRHRLKKHSQPRWRLTQTLAVGYSPLFSPGGVDSRTGGAIPVGSVGLLSMSGAPDPGTTGLAPTGSDSPSWILGATGGRGPRMVVSSPLSGGGGLVESWSLGDGPSSMRTSTAVMLSSPPCSLARATSDRHPSPMSPVEMRMSRISSSGDHARKTVRAEDSRHRPGRGSSACRSTMT